MGSTDFVFPQFEARLLTNVSATLSAPITTPTLGPTGEIGDQGHFGLYVNGHANVRVFISVTVLLGDECWCWLTG